jgi:hypothetical protein
MATDRGQEALASLAAARRKPIESGHPRFELTDEEIRRSTEVAMRLAELTGEPLAKSALRETGARVHAARSYPSAMSSYLATLR